MSADVPSSVQAHHKEHASHLSHSWSGCADYDEMQKRADMLCFAKLVLQTQNQFSELCSAVSLAQCQASGVEHLLAS